MSAAEEAIKRAKKPGHWCKGCPTCDAARRVIPADVLEALSDPRRKIIRPCSGVTE